MLNTFTLLRKLLALFLLPLAFCAAAQPVITSFTPASGPVGTPVTITGSGFNATAAGNIVYFGAVRAAVTAASTTSITVTVPAGATYEPVSVLNTATALTGYASKPFAATFTNPFGMGLPPNYYLPRVPYPTDYAASFVTISDVDVDGKPDLIIAGFSGISVFRNISTQGSIGPASFADRVSLIGGSIHDAVVVKDVDGDGKPDIVGVSGFYNTVSIWHNASTPGSINSASFGTPLKLSPGSGTAPYNTFIAVGDLDSDGKPDIVTLNPNLNALAIFRNTSTAGSLDATSFAARLDVPTAPFLNNIAISDIDGDGQPDLVTANQNLSAPGLGSLSVLRNQATKGSLNATSFAVPVVVGSGYVYRSFAVGDIDGDGKPDLLTQSGSSAASVLRNTATAGTINASSFSPAVNFPSSGSGLTIGDVDGDGKLDVLTARTDLLGVLRNKSTAGSINASSFDQNVEFVSPNAGSGVAVGDLDGDGIAEVVITNNSTFSVSVMRANTASLATAPQISSFNPSFGGPVGSTVTINGSGFNPTAANNSVFFGTVRAVVNSASVTTLTVTVPAGSNYQPISVLNTANGLTGYASKPFTTTFSNPYPAGIPFNFYSPKVDFATGTLPYSVALGDLDGDGKQDMVVANASAGTVSVLRNAASSGAGPASFAAKVDFPVGADPRAVAIGDVDGDGKPDIVVANSGSATLSVLHNASSTGAINPSSFQTKIDFATGAHPFSVVIGDVDADGRPELITANLSAGTVSVLRNTATTGVLTASSFAPRTDFPAGSSPRFVALGNVDGDARPDLAVANEQSGTASVLRNTAATGTINASSFAAPLSFTTGSSPNFIAATDIDGDGKADLVTVNYGSNTVSVLRSILNAENSLSATSFLPKVDFATGPQPFFAAINDLDGNGKPDIAVVNAASTNISVLRNVSSTYEITPSSFAPKVDFAAGNYPVAIAAGDLDGNGIAELVAVDAATDRVSTYAFNSPQAIRISSISPATGPVGSTVTITGEGFDFTPSLNQVFFGAVKAEVTGGNTTTLRAKVPAGATYYPVSVSKNVAEVAAYSPLPFVTTFANPFGSGIPANFYRPRVDVPLSGSFTYSVAFGDLNLDGKPDLLAVNEQSNILSVSRNISATGSIAPSSFASPVNFETAGAPRMVAFADIDGYFYPDVIVLSPSSNTISVFRNTFNYLDIDFNALYPRVDFPTGGYASSFAVGDLDGDGRPEIVLTNPYSNAVTVLRNQSSRQGNPLVAFAAGVSFPAGNFPRSVAVSDVNGDGKRDIIVVNEQGNAVSVLLNKAVQGNINVSSFAARVEFPVGGNPPAVAVGDLDGDGKPDIVTANYSSGTVSVLRNTSPFGMGSAAQFAAKADFATGNNPYSVAIGDADGDGKPDIITANSNANTLSVLRNLSTAGTIAAGSFAGKVDFATGGYPLGIALGDLDGDGVAELASANAANGASAISIFKIAPVPMAAAAAAAGLQTSTADQPVMMIQAFPNPTRGEFVLRLQADKTGIMNIEVLDERGKTIEKRALHVAGKPALSALSLSLHNRPAGVYYVKATGLQGVQVVKIVVQR